MGMAHSVEGRFPFLDYRLVEFACRLPSRMKLRCLTDKFILRQAAQKWLPPEILSRPKRPYRAPIHKSFFGVESPDYVEELLSEKSVNEAGLFDADMVTRLVQQLRAGKNLGETDDMALAGLISTQLVFWQFLKSFPKAAPISDDDDVKVCVGGRVSRSAITAVV